MYFYRVCINNEKGVIRLIDDDLIKQMLKDNGPLLRDYFEEERQAST